MLLFLSIMSWTLSLIFLFINHPLSLGLILLVQTVIIALISGILNLDFWFSYILFLIMIGGMLVLFIYMTSIASDEKFKFSKLLTLMMCIALLMAMLALSIDKYLYMMNMHNHDLVSQDFLNTNLSMNKLMNYPGMMVMFMLMIYLLITLIVIVKITKSKQGPLRMSL
uniref:NADH-ubiquinone oxidoreductase chain 6 n=1 Tax=Pachyrhinus yasumatsui TaxID=2071596 RepID=A0A343SB18_9CUCU|nr:NADH dehydrogenase subunit 6 [Pachyrhinus yasumatsui]